MREADAIVGNGKPQHAVFIGEFDADLAALAVADSIGDAFAHQLADLVRKLHRNRLGVVRHEQFGLDVPVRACFCQEVAHFIGDLGAAVTLLAAAKAIDQYPQMALFAAKRVLDRIDFAFGIVAVANPATQRFEPEQRACQKLRHAVMQIASRSSA